MVEFQFVDELMPCLNEAVSSGQEARVVDVLSPGGAALDDSDLGLKKDYSITRMFGQGSTYQDLMVAVSSPVIVTASTWE